MKFTFLLSSTIHVRFIKRVEIIDKLVDQIDVFAFERKGSYPRKKINFEINTLGEITHVSYLKRLVLIAKSINKIRSAVRKADVVYTFGLDMLFLGWISKLLSFRKNVKIIYEVGDIREILIGKSPINNIARFFEKFLLRFVSVLVITSEAFYTEYFLKVLNSKSLRYHVIENKLDSDIMSIESLQEITEKDNKKFTIGYFGILRCARTLELLKLLIQKSNGKIKVYLRGLPGIKTQNEYNNLVSTEGVVNEGPYIVPDDLSEMYNSVDVVWACYPYQGKEIGNWSWAKTIRFYESCYFKKPIFVQAGTEDCKTVEQYGIGICLGLENIEKTVEYILSLSEDEISEWEKNMNALPEHIYMYSDEHEKLITLLKKLK
jgi:succinoglycan biosynthesis protein ExoL